MGLLLKAPTATDGSKEQWNYWDFPSGVGLRPLAPVHVEQPWRRARVPGDLMIRWVRRDRALVADSWNPAEIPMTEAGEAWVGRDPRRREHQANPDQHTNNVVYTAQDQTADLGAPLWADVTLTIRIVQLSALLGRGHPHNRDPHVLKAAMSNTTTHLLLPYLMAAQAQKHVTWPAPLKWLRAE